MIASGFTRANTSSSVVPKKALYRFLTMTTSGGATSNSETISQPGVPLTVVRIPFGSHLRKRVSQVRLELLPHPHNRVVAASHQAHQLVGGSDNTFSPPWLPTSEKVIQHIDHDE